MKNDLETARAEAWAFAWKLRDAVFRARGAVAIEAADRWIDDDDEAATWDGGADAVAAHAAWHRLVSADVAVVER